MIDLADGLPPALNSVVTRPLFLMRLKVAPPVMVGVTPSLERRIGVVEGGLFQGERLRGTVEPGGADWQQVRGDGAITLDVRLILKTDDGALLTMQYRGLRHGSPEVMAAVARGEVVDPAQIYFRVMATFETAAPKYAWLNGIFCVGSGHRKADGPTYSLFELL